MKAIYNIRHTIYIILVIAIIALIFWASFRGNKKDSVEIPPQTSSSLLINTDKDIYKPSEQVYIQVTASCEDKLRLEISDIQNTIYDIQVNKSLNCGKEPTQPNFTAFFTPTSEGDYKIKLTNLSSNEVTESGFLVSNEDALYSITRWGSNRVNISQSNRYPMKLIVKVNKDFKGQLIEILHSQIKLEWYGAAKPEENKLTWDVDLKAGQTQEFSYEYTVQTEASNLTFGKAKLVGGLKTVFEESKVWQVISNND